MRSITVYFRNGYAFVISACYMTELGTFTYVCDHCTVSRSSLRRILSLYPKYEVELVKNENEIIIQVHNRKGGTK